MAQAILLPPGTFENVVGVPVYFSPRKTLKIQFSPNPSIGFDGVIIFEFLIPTMLFLPWMPLGKIEFTGGHNTPVVSDCYLGPNYTCLRCRVANATWGDIAAYAAY